MRLLFVAMSWAFVACTADSFVGPDASSDAAAETPPPAEAGTDAGDFDVQGVTGLALWLRSDTGVTASGAQVVSRWADQSGNGNDATETRDGLQPTLVTPGINGLPTIHFASTAAASTGTGFQGNDLLIADSPTLEWGTGDFLVEVVARYTNDPSSATHDAFGALYVAIFGPPDMAQSGFGLYANVFQEPGDLATSSAIEGYVWGQPVAVSAGTGYNDGTAHVFAVRRASATLSVRIDGKEVGSQTIAPTDLGGTGAHLGGVQNATAQRLEGDISEVVAVSGSIGPLDLAGIEAYLKHRYSTP
jgi:hypothetical protein